MFDDVVIYGFDCLAHGGEQLFGQAAEEEVPDQVDVPGAASTIARRPPGINLISVARRSEAARSHWTSPRLCIRLAW